MAGSPDKEQAVCRVPESPARFVHLPCAVAHKSAHGVHQVGLKVDPDAHCAVQVGAKCAIELNDPVLRPAQGACKWVIVGVGDGARDQSEQDFDNLAGAATTEVIQHLGINDPVGHHSSQATRRAQVQWWIHPANEIALGLCLIQPIQERPLVRRPLGTVIEDHPAAGGRPPQFAKQPGEEGGVAPARLKRPARLDACAATEDQAFRALGTGAGHLQAKASQPSGADEDLGARCGQQVDPSEQPTQRCEIQRIEALGRLTDDQAQLADEVFVGVEKIVQCGDRQAAVNRWIPRRRGVAGALKRGVCRCGLGLAPEPKEIHDFDSRHGRAVRAQETLRPCHPLF